MKIFVRLHDIAMKSDPYYLAKKAKEIGFDGVQLVINKAIENESGLPGTLSEERKHYIAKAFKDEGLEVGMLGAYFNPVHSNKELVKTNIAKFKEYLSFAKDFDCYLVGSETGSFNDDKWTYNPLNRTEEAYQEVLSIFIDLVEHSKSTSCNVAIEGADGHCMYKPEQLHRLYTDLNSEKVSIIVDVFNYLNIENYSKEYQNDILDRCINLFGDKICIFHLKDFKVEDGKLKNIGLGDGLMDLEHLIPKIKAHCPNAYLVFEGVPFATMESSLKHIKNLLK